MKPRVTLQSVHRLATSPSQFSRFAEVATFLLPLHSPPMRRASPPFHLFAAAAATDANTAIMFPNMPVFCLCRYLHILLWAKTISPKNLMCIFGSFLQYRGRGRGFVGRYYSGGRGQFVTGDAHFRSVRDVNSGFRRGESESFVNLTRYQYPPFNPRPPPPYHRNPQFRHPAPNNQAQQVRPRPRPPDYRDWEYAATAPPPDCGNFINTWGVVSHREKIWFPPKVTLHCSII